MFKKQHDYLNKSRLCSFQPKALRILYSMDQLHFHCFLVFVSGQDQHIETSVGHWQPIKYIKKIQKF